uniref:Uncharacterized protein n=1 Tax=Coccidioides posadasii RMSCC 3488 TaxID=454284 RepID=A0A0J6F0U0_COCPO|nr:hypothetical protein CPAG_00017 [Coccidioides posadasii RMSCC 3488]
MSTTTSSNIDAEACIFKNLQHSTNDRRTMIIFPSLLQAAVALSLPAPASSAALSFFSVVVVTPASAGNIIVAILSASAGFVGAVYKTSYKLTDTLLEINKIKQST